MSIKPRVGASLRVPLSEKVRYLSQPGGYPDKPRRVETVETHMSWVFLTDRHAYKLKKPVRYEFLDFSTLAARRRDCEAEIRLNRRLAEDVYIDRVALAVDPDGHLQLEGKGKAIEWLVKMHRLPADRMLDQAIRNRTVTEGDIRRVAEKLAEFYRRSAPVEITQSAYRARFEKDVCANLRELLTPAFALPATTAKSVASAQLKLLRQEPELLDRRVGEGRIIEAHGDLRAEHICLGSPPSIIDCLEFNRDFRILDPADELAFLAMDCERLGGSFVRRLAFDTYRRVTGDEPCRRLLDFYTSYRAFLRAKIAIWHLKEEDVRDSSKWRDLAKAYLELAEHYVGEFG